MIKPKRKELSGHAITVTKLIKDGWRGEGYQSSLKNYLKQSREQFENSHMINLRNIRQCVFPC